MYNIIDEEAVQNVVPGATDETAKWICDVMCQGGIDLIHVDGRLGISGVGPRNANAGKTIREGNKIKLQRMPVTAAVAEVAGWMIEKNVGSLNQLKWADGTITITAYMMQE